MTQIERDPVSVEREVFEGIEAVRRSGQTNMLDRPRVADLANEMGFEQAARWVRENHDVFAQALFSGFEVRHHDRGPVPRHAHLLKQEPERPASRLPTRSPLRTRKSPR